MEIGPRNHVMKVRSSLSGSKRLASPGGPLEWAVVRSREISQDLFFLSLSTYPKIWAEIAAGLHTLPSSA